MSKFVRTLLLVLVMLFSIHCAAAENLDLSAMAFDELVALRNRVTDEMLTREEWNGVLVPAGTYEIGVDIPEGMWTISAEPTSSVIVKLGSGINETYTDFPDGGYITYVHLVGEQYRRYDISDTVNTTWNMAKGHYIISDGPTLWTRAVRPSLGFN